MLPALPFVFFQESGYQFAVIGTDMPGLGLNFFAGFHIDKKGISLEVERVIIGFIGCQFDSILGATLQQKKIISNDDVNFISISLSILIALSILFLIPI